MGVVANVVDGKIVNNGLSATEQAKKKQEEKKTGNSTLGKDAFLQLLVAQMKYQDPMDASNNSTEYISQLATFSELESMQNLQKSAEEDRLQALVGKTVVLLQDGKKYTGQVDYLQYESGDPKLSVNGVLYGVEDLYQIIDTDYLQAYTQAANFVAKVLRLPDADALTIENAKTVHALEDEYEEMTDYGKSFVADEVLEKLQALVPKADKLSPREVKMDYDRLMAEQMAQLLDVVTEMQTNNKEAMEEIKENMKNAAGSSQTSQPADPANPPG